METKKIGALVILGGIAILGYVYFKKNKPTTSESQIKEIERKEKELAQSMTDIDKSDFTKAKELQSKILKIRYGKKTTDLTKEELAITANLYSKLRELKYYLVGNDLRHD